MKKLLSAIAVAIATYAPFAAHATTIKFNPGLDPFFSYSQVQVINYLFVSDNGYRNMQIYTGDTNVAFNPGGFSPSTFTANSKFDLSSLLIDGAWGTQTLTIEGLLDDNTLYTKQVSVDMNPSLVKLNWAGINEFMILTGNDYVVAPGVLGLGQNWALNNVVVNENDSTVPEPATIALFGMGLLGFAASRRKNFN